MNEHIKPRVIPQSVFQPRKDDINDKMTHTVALNLPQAYQCLQLVIC